jgi:hypothetical protein
MHAIETMITTREGREIIAEALRAVATVLDDHDRNRAGQDAGSRQDRQEGSAHRFGEALDQGLHSSDPVTNPAVEMVSGAFDVAAAAANAATDVMLTGMGVAESEPAARSRGAGKRQTSQRRTPAGRS